VCGLIAIFDQAPGHAAGFQRAVDLISTRGLPGRTKVTRAFDAQIAHARLPIVGLGTEHDQPLCSETQLFAFVGEALDFREKFPRAECDAEVFFTAYCENQATRGFLAFDGFWSGVVAERKGAVGFTDHLGIKPLYYRVDAFSVGSTPQSVAALAPVTLDRVYLANVRRWGYDPTGRTPYAEVHRLAPGCAIRFHHYDHTARLYRYFKLDPAKKEPTPADLVKALTRAVKRRLVADVPIAILCSGGLDSSIVLHLAAELGAKIAAFHVDNDEREFAELAARSANVELTALPIDEADEAGARAAYGEPVDLGSVVPQHALACAIRRAGFHVAISGDGADELFGGYHRAMEHDVQASDVFCELPGYHLPRLDRIMAEQLVELRSPYLAPEVVRMALALPWGRRRSKEALKEAFRGRIPGRILDREKKPLRNRDPHDRGPRDRLVDDFVKNFEEENAV